MPDEAELELPLVFIVIFTCDNAEGSRGETHPPACILQLYQLALDQL